MAADPKSIRGTQEDARLAERRGRAQAAAAAVAAKALASRGVEAELIGSLTDQRFGRNSDVDILVTACPRSLKYAIESIVEDCLGGLSFDVLYLDELSPARAARYREAKLAIRPVG
jgi:predicted nucleotidyltransferase